MAISIKRYKNEWDSRRGFRAYNGGELAGQILADFSKESGKVRVQLYSFVVADACKQRGIGRCMMEHMAEEARRAGASSIVAYPASCTDINDCAEITSFERILVYQKLGFEVFESSIPGRVTEMRRGV